MGDQRHGNRVSLMVRLLLLVTLVFSGCTDDDDGSASGPVARVLPDNEVVSRALDSSMIEPDSEAEAQAELSTTSTSLPTTVSVTSTGTASTAPSTTTSSTTTTSTTSTSTTTTTRPTSTTTSTTRPTTTTTTPSTTTTTKPTTTTTTSTTTTTTVVVMDLDYEVDGTTISGSIVTMEGSPVQGIPIRLRDPADNAILSSTSSNANGAYLFSALANACYTLEAEAPAGSLFEPFRPDRRFARHRICV